MTTLTFGRAADEPAGHGAERADGTGISGRIRTPPGPALSAREPLRSRAPRHWRSSFSSIRLTRASRRRSSLRRAASCLISSSLILL